MEFIFRRIWKMVVVFEIFFGDDGYVRTVKIKIVNVVYDRFIYKLCLIVIKEELDNLI